tara:strand:- start:2192 stop:3226 length:1035 start_codon:yes stop_codon:yes gene_type:complete
MSIPAEQVEAWIRGSQLSKNLNPFQVIVFKFFTCKPIGNQPKHVYERSLHEFRTHYLNKYLFDHPNLPQDATSFMERLKAFEGHKKPTKKHYDELFKDLSAYKTVEWPGGHADGEPVLLGWRPRLRDCKDMYSIWYKDEVAALCSFVPNQCAVTEERYTWQEYIGPQCPANVRVYSPDCEASEAVQEYYEKCKEYSLDVRPQIEHIAESFEKAYAEVANYPEKSSTELLEEIYVARTPGGIDLVSVKRELEKKLKQFENENKMQHETIGTLRNKCVHNNKLYEECLLSMEGMANRMGGLEHSLRQYRVALEERDSIIKRGEQELHELRNTLYGQRQTRFRGQYT